MEIFTVIAFETSIKRFSKANEKVTIKYNFITNKLSDIAIYSTNFLMFVHKQ